MKFKDQHTFEKRLEESSRIRQKFGDKIPIIVEKANGTDLPDIDRKKFLCPSDLSFGQFSYVVRKRLNLREDQTMFLFVNDQFPPSICTMMQVYREHADEDCFLYCVYTAESAFGQNRL